MQREVGERTPEGRARAKLEKRIDERYPNASDEEKQAILERELSERGF
jgi:hypothetical protein